MSNIENKNVSKDVIYDENNGLYYTKSSITKTKENTLE